MEAKSLVLTQDPWALLAVLRSFPRIQRSPDHKNGKLPWQEATVLAARRRDTARGANHEGNRVHRTPAPPSRSKLQRRLLPARRRGPAQLPGSRDTCRSPPPWCWGHRSGRHTIDTPVPSPALLRPPEPLPAVAIEHLGDDIERGLEGPVVEPRIRDAVHAEHALRVLLDVDGEDVPDRSFDEEPVRLDLALGGDALAVAVLEAEADAAAEAALEDFEQARADVARRGAQVRRGWPPDDDALAQAPELRAAVRRKRREHLVEPDVARAGPGQARRATRDLHREPEADGLALVEPQGRERGDPREADAAAAPAIALDVEAPTAEGGDVAPDGAHRDAELLGERGHGGALARAERCDQRFESLAAACRQGGSSAPGPAHE